MFQSFSTELGESGIEVVRTPARCPQANAYLERWIRSAKEECLNHLIFFGSNSILRARNHQGIGNVIPMPRERDRIGSNDGVIVREQRIGGMLSFYRREAV